MIHLVNHLAPTHRSIDQYAIIQDSLVVGGFTLAVGPEDMLLFGLHNNGKRPLIGLFRELRRLYPEIKVIRFYRSTGLHRGEETWMAHGRGWKEDKGGLEGGRAAEPKAERP